MELTFLAVKCLTEFIFTSGSVDIRNLFGEYATLSQAGYGLAVEGSGNADIRGPGIDYSSWNLTPSASTDRNAYTHIINNPYVKSVQPVINIVKLNDTQHESVSEYNITEKPGLLEVKVDLRFRIGVQRTKVLELG